MKKEDFRYMTDCKKAFEFKHNGVTYNLTYGKDSKGEYFAFGKLYEQQKYYSFADLLNEARIDNSYLKDFLEVL